MSETSGNSLLQAAIDNAGVSIMMCDRDLKITYANNSTMNLLKKYQGEFSRAYPGFDPEKLIGTCVDIFHKNPAHQRQLLGNPRNLPHTADIEVGPLTFALNISAMFDGSGEYVGNCLEWQEVSEQRRAIAEYKGQVTAIGKAQATIEFNLDGTIITANDNFLKTMGYTLEEIQGKHHSIFVDEAYRVSSEYRQFWENLNRGEYQASEYRRLGKGGKEVWIQASYNPILDSRGKPFKVIKYATDITAQRRAKSKAESMFSMIEGATANFMTCDTDLKITYINPSLMEMFQLREVDIRKTLPRFDSRNIIGMCIDDFHKNPSHQRRLLGDPRNLPAKAEIEVGPLVFQVTATALIDSDGNLLGNAAEWTDLNDRSVYSKEVNDLIAAGMEGDLKKRGRLEVLSDVYKPMMQGINEILDAVVAPISEAGNVLQQVGRQDLTVRVMGDYKGDHAAIKNNLNGALESLEVALSRARDASQQVNQASEQIATSSQTLAEGASEQASALEEVSASLEELTAMTAQNADNASQADVLAKESRAMATRGNEAMANMEIAINKIKTSSDQTAKIIKTIDEIAFQTNLLALNAAVEAARAGEAGKGFAVVAEEVRNLAARSAEAARNTAEMIEEAVKNAEGGVKISNSVADILKDIMSSASKVSDFIAEIAAASKEQAVGLSQINKAVSEMDKVTQSNAAGSEESAAAAEELSAQAESLGSIISAFRISNGAGGMGMPYGMQPMGNYQGGMPPAAQQQYWQQPPSQQWQPPQQQWQPPQQQWQPPQQQWQPPQQQWQPPQQQPPRWQAPAQQSPTRPAGTASKPVVERRVRKPEEVIPLDDSDLHDF